jgi:hypothetical protein
LTMFLFLTACNSKPEIISPTSKCGEIVHPTNLDDSIRFYLREKEGYSSGVNNVVVRFYADNLYLVAVDEHYTPPVNSNGNTNTKPSEIRKTVNYIAQRTRLDDANSPWVFQEATVEAMQLYGMKCE